VDQQPQQAVASRAGSIRVMGRRVRLVSAAVLVVATGLSTPLPAQSKEPLTRVVRIPSKALGETRVVHVSVPPNYKLAKRRYPVVVLLDGQVRAFFDLAVAATGYSLTGDPRDFAMPAQIVVGVEQGDRGADLSRNDEAFSRFILDELLPTIDREYRTLPYRTLIGHSLGGRFALLALCRAPTQISATIAISPSLSDSLETVVRGCIRAHAASPRPRVRQLVLSAGSREARSLGTVQRLGAFIRDSMPRTWRVGDIDGEGQGHTDTPFMTIPQGLRFVFDGSVWEIDRAAADSLLARQGEPGVVLQRALAGVSARLGFTVEPSPKWMEAVTRTYLARGASDSALVSAQRFVAAYPEELVGFALLADAHLARRETSQARRALIDALALLEKLDWFDETQREQQRAYYRVALARIAP
jgi:predicted alpha/beta superfamily hydrolase